MTSPVDRVEAPVLTDAAIIEAAAAVREFEKAGMSPPKRLVAVAGRAATIATAARIRTRRSLQH